MSLPFRRGFTVIELLVTIGVIGILLALLLPALSGARVSARQTVALGNVRSVGQNFLQYTNDHVTFPFRAKGTRVEGQPPLTAGDPNVLVSAWWPEGSWIAVSDHWAQSYLWPGIVRPVKEWPGEHRTWISPGRPTTIDEIGAQIGVANLISVLYAHTFVAKPALFTRNSTGDASLLAAVRPDEVAFPSNKVMLWDQHVAYLTKEPKRGVSGFYEAPTPMAFADGHGDVKDPTTANPGVPNPLNMNNSAPINSTENGVRGRDF